jgi:prevent-host-death family protein
VKTLEMSRATESLADYARGVAMEAVVVTRRGKPVAVLVPIKNADLESVAISTNPEFLKIIRKSRASLRRRGGLTLRGIESRLRSD